MLFYCCHKGNIFFRNPNQFQKIISLKKHREKVDGGKWPPLAASKTLWPPLKAMPRMANGPLLQPCPAWLMVPQCKKKAACFTTGGQIENITKI